MSRDLLGIAQRSEGAVSDLTDDLSNLGRYRAPQPVVQEMAAALNTALAGKSTSPDAAQRLAESLFVTFAARDLSEQQIEQLEAEVRSRARAAGADEGPAAAVSAVVGKYQRGFTVNDRRWYHVF